MPSTISGQSLDKDVARMAQAAVAGDALLVRAIAMELTGQSLNEIASPTGLTPLEQCVAAGLVEMLAERTGQTTPTWTQAIPAATEPFFLVRHATTMPRLRRDCEQYGPPVLRARNLFAPGNYLTFL